MPDTLARPLGFLSILLGVASIALLLSLSGASGRAAGPGCRPMTLPAGAPGAAGAGVIAALVRLVVWLRRRKGGAAAVLLGLVLSLPVAGLGAGFEIAARTTPPINWCTVEDQGCGREGQLTG